MYSQVPASAGAADSESHYNFNRLARKTVSLREPYKPRWGPSEWELYDTLAAQSVANELNKRSDQIMELLSMCNRKELAALDKHFGWELDV